MRSRRRRDGQGDGPPEAGGTRPAQLAELAADYGAERARVDASHRRMQAVVAAPHEPAEARTAAVELTRALREATRTVTRAVRIATEPPPPHRRSLRHRKAGRAVPAAVRPWSGELVRLAEMGAWLRRTTLDDLGVDVPMAVRVGSLAATGPHIAGMVAEPDDLVAATLHEPRIGVDLRATVDDDGHAQEPPVRSSSVARAA